LGERISNTDFALHDGVGHDNLDDLPGLWQAGCKAFKIFMCDSGSKVAGPSKVELVRRVRAGVILTMGSDHGPVDARLKRQGEGNI
jgi:hypothetical protein